MSWIEDNLDNHIHDDYVNRKNTYKGKTISFDLKDALENINLKESNPYIGVGGGEPFELNGKQVVSIACDQDTDEGYYVTVPVDNVKINP